jgi:hypothetical protein
LIAVGLKRMGTTEVLCFELWYRAPFKGDVQVENRKRIPGVVGARRLTRWVNGEKKKVYRSCFCFK